MKKYIFYKISIITSISILFILFFSIYMYLYNPNSIIPNRELEKSIREQINKHKGNIKPEDCKGVTVLRFNNLNFIKKLDGIQYFTDLETLECKVCSVSDISALKELYKLKYLNLYKNNVKDLKPLSELINLENLNLYDNNFYDITPMASLINLKELQIGKNPVENLQMDFYRYIIYQD